MEVLTRTIDYVKEFSRLSGVFRYWTCVVALIFFISVDVRNAFKKKAHWVPGETLALTALTIQFIAFIDNPNYSVLEKLDYDAIVENEMIITCVFIAYMVPGMARSGLIDVWSTIGALVIFSNYYYTRYSLFMLVAKIVLSLLLTCAVWAGKSIRVIISERVPLKLSCCSESAEKKCKEIEDHVFKCWIVCRACQPDYIIARSVFSAFAGLKVTCCVLIFLWRYHTYYANDRFGRLDQASLAIQAVFILTGWMVVFWRWFTAVVYFPRQHLSSVCYWEDFWTRHIFEVKSNIHIGQLSGTRRNRLRQRSITIILCLVRSFKLYYLLNVIACFVNCMVFVSKVCWYLSQFSLGELRRLMMSAEQNYVLRGLNISSPETDQFLKYSDTLDFIRMPGEMAYSLWIANEWAFKQTEKHMIKGLGEGTLRCDKLKKLLRERNGLAKDEDQDTRCLEQIQKHFKYIDRTCWKMRAVSFLHLMVFSYHSTNSQARDLMDLVGDAIHAYSQARDLMDFVDSSDPEAKFSSRAADIEFSTLERTWKKYVKMQSNLNENQSYENGSKELLADKILKPLEAAMKELDEITEGQRNPSLDGQQDSKDWIRQAAKVTMYKRWKDREQNIHHDRQFLANVIAQCLEEELEKALIENCNKWAEEGEEQKIYHAAYIAGKAKGLKSLNGFPEICENNPSTI